MNPFDFLSFVLYRNLIIVLKIWQNIIHVIWNVENNLKMDWPVTRKEYTLNNKIDTLRFIPDLVVWLRKCMLFYLQTSLIIRSNFLVRLLPTYFLIWVIIDCCILRVFILKPSARIHLANLISNYRIKFYLEGAILNNLKYLF